MIIKYTKVQKATLRVAIATAFITTFMGSALNLAIPNIESQFGVSAVLIGWIVTSYTLSVAALSVPFGKIADATGRRRVLVFGVLFFCLTSIAVTLSPNITFMIVTRVLQGIASAMIFATNNAILISEFPSSERGNVLGKSVASTYVGLAAGPVIGGFLNKYMGWKSIFWFAFFVGVVALIIAVIELPKDKKTINSQKSDKAGNILYIGAIVTTIYGLSNIFNRGYAFPLVALGLFMGLMFVKVELKATDPIMEVRFFANDSIYTLSNIAALLNYGATFAISYLMSIYLQIVMGYGSEVAGLILIVQPIIMAVLSPKAGKMSDKIEPYKLATAGMACCTMGLLIFANVGLTTKLWVIILALMITGAGFALFSSPNTNAVMGCVEKKDYGVTSSILATMRTIGQTMSMVIVTVIAGVYIGNTQLTNSDPIIIIKTTHIAFLVFVVLCFFGTLISLKRKK